MSRPIFAEVNLAAIKKNYLLAKKLATKNPPIAVIKANAYGLGILPVAKALAEHCQIFAVSSLDEAILLRQNFIKNKILLLEGFFDESELKTLVEADLIPVIHNQFQLDLLHKSKFNQQIPVWLKFNTGMNRLGFDRKKILQILQKGTGAYVPTTLITHFATADLKESQACHNAYKEAFDLAHKNQLALSVSNSAALLAFGFVEDWARVGIMLCGASPLAYENNNSLKLKSAVALKSKILAIHNLKAGEALGYGAAFVAQKPMRVATIAGGYGDGFSREHYKAPVYFRKKLCPIVGRISMDMMTIDISGVENAKIGDQVEFFGENLKIEEVARLNSTISYTLITHLMQRVERIYSHKT